MTKTQIERIKEQFPKGTRVQLNHMGDDPNSIPSGTKGTVACEDDTGTVFCNFDNGRNLGICPEADSFHKISEQKKNFEPTMSM